MKLGPTNHAVERYVERVKPAISLVVARQELQALIEMAGPSTPRPPEWLRTFDAETEGFMELSDGIVATIKGDAVTTVLIRSTDAPHIKAIKAEAKRKRRTKRRWRNQLTTQGRHKKGAAPAWD